MKNRMIVGYDGSAASTNALRWAASEAELRGASLRVLSSYAPPPVLDVGFGASAAIWDDPDIADWTQNHVREAVVAALEQHPTVGHEALAVNARPAQALLQAAEEADLLVVGRSGAGAMSHLLLGSVTSELLAASPCPLVVTPPETHDVLRRIVVGTDGSDHAARAVEWAVEQADRHQCDLVVVHAWSPPHRFKGAAAGSGSTHEADAELVLERAVAAAREASSGTVVPTLVESGAAQALLDVAETGDLVVVGSRGRGGFRSMLFGSVAHAIAANAPCPAVIVR